MPTLKQSQAALALRQAGYRLTKPRLAILQVLQENGESLSPEEICQRGKAIYGPLGLVTVYRTLEVLSELGLVRRVHSGPRCHSYAGAGSDRHYVICEGCHRVIEFPCMGLLGLIEGVQARTGFVITQHLIELSGMCPDCQRQSSHGLRPTPHEGA
jgi:Fur family ferric uptake transcriptional regulator